MSGAGLIDTQRERPGETLTERKTDKTRQGKREAEREREPEHPRPSKTTWKTHTGLNRDSDSNKCAPQSEVQRRFMLKCIMVEI